MEKKAPPVFSMWTVKEIAPCPRVKNLSISPERMSSPDQTSSIPSIISSLMVPRDFSGLAPCSGSASNSRCPAPTTKPYVSGYSGAVPSSPLDSMLLLMGSHVTSGSSRTGSRFPNLFLLSGVSVPKDFTFITVKFNFACVGPRHLIGRKLMADVRDKRESHFQSTSHAFSLCGQAICHVMY